jgi:hypothetical protein
VPLRIRVDGVGEWTTDDYTLDEMVAAEKQRDLVWSFLLQRAGAGDAECVRALIVVWLARTEADADVAAERAGALTNRQVRVEPMEDDDRPVQYEDGLPVVDPKAAVDGQVTT